MNAPADNERLFVVVPFYNEERGMLATLRALAGQLDRDFSLVLVDNCSTDGSVALVEEFALQHRDMSIQLLHEPIKGTGAASDTGFRFAITQGAQWIARTDADCLPDPDWIQNLKVALSDDGLEFVAGRILLRNDERSLTPGWRLLIAMMLWIAENYGKIHRRGPQFRYPYFMAAGNNLAISASLYELSGGFPRSTLEELNEDRVLSETVRTLTAHAARRPDIIVRNSARRVHAYGVINTLRWYRNRGYQPEVVDVR
ncbi:MAG: glycosyltransferase family 2 protein [Gammaproteobacteria bacterium]|nr:glycosyltransferase family 2 protein [Gammaproteobacteria bacterium]